eukprot:GHVU01140049.1.p1 GENE.GHVU01140049.1~~GHVU01140049.1.p1  ORF type:complete len:254 (+),score=29.95 GHVU01140049.1:166-927(+)
MVTRKRKSVTDTSAAAAKISWDEQQDVWCAQACARASADAAKGTHQKRGDFYEAAGREFNLLAVVAPEQSRTGEAVRKRFAVIRKDTSFYVEAIAFSKKRMGSGGSPSDVDAEADRLYKMKTGGAYKFKNSKICYEVMKDVPIFWSEVDSYARRAKTTSSSSSSSTAAAGVSSEAGVSSAEGGEMPPRPLGQKRAKAEQHHAASIVPAVAPAATGWADGCTRGGGAAQTQTITPQHGRASDSPAKEVIPSHGC